jgi:hypothetical protein
VSWHREDDLVVLSLWNGPRCTGTVRVAAADVPALIEALQIGLRSQPDQPPADQALTDEAPTDEAPTDETPTDEAGTVGRVTDDREDGVAG